MGIPGRGVLVTATAVVSANPATVSAVVIGVLAASNTIKLHNCKTTGAAAAGNEVARIATDTVGDFDFGNLGAYFDQGVVAVVSGGSPVATVVLG